MVVVVLFWVGVVGGGRYQPVLAVAGSGATVPLPGFGYNMAKGAMEGAKNGFLGAITGPVGSAAAGIGTALGLGYIISLIFNPRSPKR